MTIIAITTFKGGVGKTTSARELVAALARSGRRVLAVDLDRTQRHLMKFADAVPGVEFRAITAGRVRGLVERVRAANDCDALIIDCPPALSREAGAALECADIVLAPVQPEYLAADGLVEVSRAVVAARRARFDPTRAASMVGEPRLRVLITMLDPRDSTHPLLEKSIRENFAAEVFGETIKRHQCFNLAALAGSTVIADAPRSQGARCYRALATELVPQVLAEAVQDA